MDENNNENVNRLYLKYDLRTNYLYGVQVKSLKEFSTFKAVVNSYECDEAIEELRSLFCDHRYNTDKLFTIIENNLQVQILPISLRKKVKLTIRLVYGEIKRFLEIFLETDIPLFFGNFVFNWQGVINPRETFLQVLERSKLSTQKKFEFSCKFLFDEDKIFSYFKNLTPNIQNYYRNISNYLNLGKYGFLIFYWVKRSTEPPAEIQRMYLQELVNNYSRSTYFVRNFCSDIGVQYLVENIAQDNVPLRLIFDFLMDKQPTYSEINVLMYLLFQLRQDELFNTGCDIILMKLVSNSMWHDNFIKYYRLFRNHIDEYSDEYLYFTSTVVMVLGRMVKIEGKIGKFFPILKDFITLIPISAKTSMKDDYEESYAKILFDLFVHEDIVLIRCFLDTENENSPHFGYRFYKLAATYFDDFTKAYDECLNNIRNFLREKKSEDQADRECSNIIESFLRNIIQLEYHASHLLGRLKFGPSHPHPLIV